MDMEIQKVMELTGMERLPAWRHVLARRELSRRRIVQSRNFMK